MTALCENAWFWLMSLVINGEEGGGKTILPLRPRFKIYHSYSFSGGAGVKSAEIMSDEIYG